MNPNNVASMVWQGERYLWIGNSKGIARWDRSTRELEIFKDVDECPSVIITYHPETIWCGATQYDGSTWYRFDLNLRQIIQDNDRTIWAGSAQGLMRFDSVRQKWDLVAKTTPHEPEPYVASAGNGIHLSLASSDGHLWFVSNDNPYKGTTRWTGTSHQTFLLDEWGNSLMVPKLEATDGSVWGGGSDGLVARWDRNDWRTWHIKLGTALPPISKILEAKDGAIWVRAEVDGVARWDGENWQTWNRAAGIGNSSESSHLVLTSIILTADDNVWVGTSKEGISRWDGQTWRTYTIADGLSSEKITALSKNPDGTLWTGTWGGGVNYYDPKTDRWHSFPEK